MFISYLAVVKVIKMALQNKNKIRSVVICPDKFKGGLKSAEVASAIKEGLENYILDRKGEESLFSQDICFDIVEMADGGDGSAGLFAKLTGGRMVECEVCGPLGNNVPSCYVLGKDSEGKLAAFVECAKACGLAMVPEEKRNPLYTTTFGVGQLIRHAVENGASTVYVGVGGSSSNDCGIGMLQGMGFSVGLPEGVKGCGGNLCQAGEVREPSDKSFLEKLKATRFIIINDVDNPLCGPRGAAFTYSPQKGADEEMVRRLDHDSFEFLSRCGRTSFSRTDAMEASLLPGAGTAGGMGFALLHFLGAEAISGFGFFGEVLQDLGGKIAEANLVISGEGSLDSQSLYGKVVGGCCSSLRNCRGVKDKRFWLFCGKGTLSSEELASSSGGAIVGIYQLADIEPDMKARMKREYPLLKQLAYCAAMEMDALL